MNKETKSKSEFKRYMLLNPIEWGLDPEKDFVAVETKNGYAIRLKKDAWIGLPKYLVEENPEVFKLLKDGSGETE